MKTISRYIMTLALLLTAVTGAWAETTVTWDTETWASWTDNTVKTHTVDGVTITAGGNATVKKSSSSDNLYIFVDNSASNTLTFSAEAPITRIEMTKATASSSLSVSPLDGWSVSSDGTTVTWEGTATKSLVCETCTLTVSKIKFYLEDAPITVEPVEGKTNEWTFAMPGSDVVLTPIYAKAAAFATTGTGSEAKTLLPAAAEGVIAGTDASLIAENTGIVANIGSTETAQGTLMYAIGTSDTQAPAPDVFSATVPTAKGVADDGADVYVWYYIQGADAPQSEAATLDNTFDNTEPACLTVQVLTNKFDITLNAANANTIETGKATVTVDGTAATVTKGKLQGVKMGSEVKLEAKPGYKFRKVEVKKAAAEPVADIVWDATNVSGLIADGYGTSYKKEGVTLSCSAGDIFVGWSNSADPTMVGIVFDMEVSGGYTFTAPDGKKFTKIEMKPQSPEGWNEANLGTGWMVENDMDCTVTWKGDSAASTVGLLTGADSFYGAAPVKSIAFYLSE